MYLAEISVRRIEDVTEFLWGTKVSPSEWLDLFQGGLSGRRKWDRHAVSVDLVGPWLGLPFDAVHV